MNHNHSSQNNGNQGWLWLVFINRFSHNEGMASRIIYMKFARMSMPEMRKDFIQQFPTIRFGLRNYFKRSLFHLYFVFQLETT